MFKDVIFDVLEAMAMNKMNVLHWHIVDDQSFPYHSKVYPDLSQKGAYHPSFVYSHEDIAEIIDYARLRGIRVMPEFDTPGHTYSWGLSRPDLLTQCYQGAHPVNGYLGPMDPSKNETYRFLKNFFNEVMHVFKDQYLHLGGDEVPMTCWSSNPDVLKLLNQLDGKPDQPINLQNNDPYMYSYEIRKVLEYYEKRLTTDLKSIGNKRPNGVRFVMWQEIMNNNVQLPNDTIIQIWQGDMGDVQRAIDMGYNVVYSTCWYLDLIEYGVKWPKYYNCDPVDTSFGYQINEKKVLGGEACIWAEYLDNENLMTTLWPRASAPAERLWSNKEVRDVEAAGKRLTEHRCRMLSRGLQVGMISGPDYCLLRVRRHDRDGERNCTGGRCYRDVIQNEKINVHVQQRGKGDCNQMMASSGSMMSTVLIVIVVLMFFIASLKVSGAKVVQVKMCRNKTILIAFLGLLVVYFMCYTSLWISVMEIKGSFEKRVKSSYPESKYS
ncbi:HEXA_B [Mytilus edulis]|uniref:beta-N-acetylhexosaminidase n=1 Tax=Mytilus edulis TaxID=6550 RepID=A0A8S3S577_MYTED|nr:HEXA_B [Mytilus edulis]